MPRRTAKKLTVLVPPDLIRRATRASGLGITPTVQMGLRLIAAKQAYDRLRRYRGRVRFSRSWKDLRAD